MSRAIWSRLEARAHLLSLHSGQSVHYVSSVLAPSVGQLAYDFVCCDKRKRNRNREMILEVIPSSMNVGVINNDSS